jgi:hypothetical protein
MRQGGGLGKGSSFGEDIFGIYGRGEKVKGGTILDCICISGFTCSLLEELA